MYHFNNQLSKIGLGCVTFGREITEKASFDLMDYAFANGINFFDTAAAYSHGASESIVGSWIASRKPASTSIIVATKILPPFDPKSIFESVAKSMRRLGTKTIDLLYLHCWDPAIEASAALNALDNLVKEGKVRMIGASNFTAEQLSNVLNRQSGQEITSFSVVQNNHNLAVRNINENLRLVCKENEIDIVSYSPLGAGFLTGKHTCAVQAGSRFDLVPEHKDIYFNESAYRRLSLLREIADREGFSPAHLALAWALHQRDVASVLVGGRNIMHLDQAFAAMNFNEPEIFAEIEST